MTELVYPKRLLLLGCSSRKLDVAEDAKLAAIELYDGVAYRAYWKWFISVPMASKIALSTYILSAKHGLISEDTEIATYDLKMTKEMALRYRRPASAAFTEVLIREKPAYVHLFMGATYLSALRFVDWSRVPGLWLEWDPSGIGVKLGALKEWLHADDERTALRHSELLARRMGQGRLL